MKKTYDYLQKISLSIALTGFTLFISSLILSFVTYGRKGSDAFPLMMLVSMTIANIVTLAVFWLYLKRSKRTVASEFNLKERVNFRYLVASILAPLIIVAFTFVYIILFPNEPGSANETTKTLTQYNGPWPYFVAFLYPVIVAPIFEEVVYRGIFGSIFNVFNEKSRLNYVMFTATSVLIFGALHFQSTGTTFSIITSFLFPAFSGLVFSLEYLKTKNIIYPIITHSVYNFIIVILQFV